MRYFIFTLALFLTPPAFAQSSLQPVPTLSESSLEIAEGSEPTAQDEGYQSPIDVLTEKYKETGRAEVLEQSGRIVYPFGHKQPVLRCSQLRACAIKLQQGEQVISAVPGDPIRWSIKKTEMGPQSSIPILVVKPKAEDITSNLIVTTDKRMYHLTLDSPPTEQGSETNPMADYTREVAYYYPDEQIEQERTRVQQVQQQQASEIPLGPNISLTDIDMGWRFNKGEHFPWRPLGVFAAGDKLFIQMPPSATTAPTLYARGPGGELRIINYSLVNGHYVAPLSFEEATLMMGVDKKSGFFGLGGKERTRQTLRIWKEK